MNTKISDAAVEAASSMYEAQVLSGANHELAWVAALDAALCHLAADAVPVGQERREGCTGTMSDNRVAFFLRRFKREEKLLGPHEQWAVDVAISRFEQQDAPPAQGICLSSIATHKLGELAAQGYVTNGVAIFNPATGQRGLVDNLGFVGWVGAQGIDLGQFRDLIGFAVLNAIYLPESDPRRDFIRQANELLALIDSQRDATTLANVTPPRDLRTQLPKEADNA